MQFSSDAVAGWKALQLATLVSSGPPQASALLFIFNATSVAMAPNHQIMTSSTEAFYEQQFSDDVLVVWSLTIYAPVNGAGQIREKSR